MLVALTRPVTPAISCCELEYLDRSPIDPALAAAQHLEYERCLAVMGAAVTSLPPEPDLPDAVFVEDPALILDEIAVVTRPGAASRRPETESIAKALAPYRSIARIEAPGTLEGGDVMRAGSTLFVGLSGRTNRAGIEQLSSIAAPFGYRVQPVQVTGCLHLKSACCYLGDRLALANRRWFDSSAVPGMRFIDVSPSEPNAANVLAIGDFALYPESFPATAERLRRAGLRVLPIDISEMQKAEAGVTCCSLVFET
jgi:dimethylargininase